MEKESINELKEILSDENKRSHFIDLLSKEVPFSEFSLYKMDESLHEILKTIFKLGLHSTSLNEKLNGLNQVVQYQKPYVERIFERQKLATLQNQLKANEFIFKLKDTFFEIENNIKNSGEKLTLERIAEEFNHRKIKTPQGKDVWHRSTVRLAIIRIKEIEKNQELSFK